MIKNYSSFNSISNIQAAQKMKIVKRSWMNFGPNPNYSRIILVLQCQGFCAASPAIMTSQRPQGYLVFSFFPFLFFFSIRYCSLFVSISPPKLSPQNALHDNWFSHGVLVAFKEDIIWNIKWRSALALRWPSWDWIFCARGLSTCLVIWSSDMH